jgi:5-carboxymethyl-2-hydroxymuconate isomerase
MPHLSVEYSSNLGMSTPNAMLTALNQTLLDTGHFLEEDIKSRAIEITQYAVGIKDEPRGFCHATLLLLSGRNTPSKQAISQALVQRLATLMPTNTGLMIQISVHLQDMDRATYAKIAIPA